MMPSLTYRMNEGPSSSNLASCKPNENYGEEAGHHILDSFTRYEGEVVQRMSDCEVAMQNSGYEGQDGTDVSNKDRVCENNTDDVALGPAAQVTGGDEHMKDNVGWI